jgi:hypothetical protein
MFRDLLRIDLPAASVLATGNVQTRLYPLTLFCNQYARIVRTVIESISFTPVVAKPEIAIMSGGGEYGKYTGSDGLVPMAIEFTDFEPLKMAISNLSPDSPASLTFVLTGYQYGEA